MNQQGGTGMTAHMVGYPFFDTTQSGQLSKLLIHFRVTRQSGKTSDIRIAVKNAQCPAFKQQMQRQTDFHPCLDGFEVQPPLAVYPNEILRCELAEVRIAQSGITAEQEGLLGINDTWYKRRFGEITDFNEANNTGYMFVDKTQSLDNKPNTSSNYGFLETIAINEVTIKQTFVDFQSRFFIRICNNGTWTDWKQIQTT